MKTKHNPRSNRAIQLSMFWIASLILLAAAPSAAAGSDDAGAARPGWYLGLGVSGSHLGLDDAVEARFSALDVDLSSTGQGGSLFVGYSFGNRFLLELNLRGANMSTGTTDIDAGVGSIEVVAIAPLMPESRVSPYLLGSLGGGALVFSGDGIDDQSLVAAQTGVGAGVSIPLSRHFGVDFEYKIAVQHYQQEVLTLSSGADRTIDFEGSGVSQSWGMRVVFSF